jgi:hypothetical protein
MPHEAQTERPISSAAIILVALARHADPPTDCSSAACGAHRRSSILSCDALTLILFVRLCRYYVLKAVLLELLYEDRPYQVAHEGLAERTERDDFVVGHGSF